MPACKVAIAAGTLESFGRQELLSLKTAGFSDRQIGRYTDTSDDQVGRLLHAAVLTWRSVSASLLCSDYLFCCAIHPRSGAGRVLLFILWDTCTFLVSSYFLTVLRILQKNGVSLRCVVRYDARQTTAAAQFPSRLN